MQAEGSLDGFLTRLHDFPQNDGQASRQNDQVCVEGSSYDVG